MAVVLPLRIMDLVSVFLFSAYCHWKEFPTTNQNHACCAFRLGSNNSLCNVVKVSTTPLRHDLIIVVLSVEKISSAVTESPLHGKPLDWFLLLLLLKYTERGSTSYGR